MTQRRQDRIFSRIEGIRECLTGASDEDRGIARGGLEERCVETVEPICTEPAEERGGAVDVEIGCRAEDALPSPEPVVLEGPPVCGEPAGDGEAVVVYSRIHDILSSFRDSFVLISPGTFMMGSPESEPGRGFDEPMHEVTITKAFHMMSAPVTQRLWKAVMGRNPASFRNGGDDLPVEGITWNEVMEFIEKISSIGGLNYSLPTEAEWEYACRAGSRAAFGRGEITELYCGHDPVLWDTGWYCGNSGRRTRPIATKAPNAWGLYDMHGNVGEWCLDWYGDYPAKASTDPRGPESGPGRVVRGGSWFSNAGNCRSAARFHWPPGSRSDAIGFRLVREV